MVNRFFINIHYLLLYSINYFYINNFFILYFISFLLIIIHNLLLKAIN